MVWHERNDGHGFLARRGLGTSRTLRIAASIKYRYLYRRHGCGMASAAPHLRSIMLSSWWEERAFFLITPQTRGAGARASCAGHVSVAAKTLATSVAAWWRAKSGDKRRPTVAAAGGRRGTENWCCSRKQRRHLRGATRAE